MNFENMGSEAWTLIATYGIRVVGVLVALFAAWVVSSMAKRALLKVFARSNFDATLSKFFSNMARYSILTFAVVGCLEVFGIETSSFAAVIAAAGLAIGLAFQGTLSNFSAGVMLLIFRPFRVGDYVTVGGTSGTVEEIDLFTTELKTPDSKMIVMPNSSIFGAEITNFSAHENRRVDIDVGTDYGADLDRVREVLETVPGKVDGVLTDPAPQIFLKALGGSSIDWQVRVWCKNADFWDVWQRTVRATKVALDEAEIGIPFPQMDVHLDKGVVDAIGKR